MSTFLFVLAVTVTAPVWFVLGMGVGHLLTMVVEGWAYMLTPEFWRGS